MQKRLALSTITRTFPFALIPMTALFCLPAPAIANDAPPPEIFELTQTDQDVVITIKVRYATNESSLKEAFRLDRDGPEGTEVIVDDQNFNSEDATETVDDEFFFEITDICVPTGDTHYTLYSIDQDEPVGSMGMLVIDSGEDCDVGDESGCTVAGGPGAVRTVNFIFAILSIAGLIN